VVWEAVDAAVAWRRGALLLVPEGAGGGAAEMREPERPDGSVESVAPREVDADSSASGWGNSSGGAMSSTSSGAEATERLYDMGWETGTDAGEIPKVDASS
jgi:hypothetical protein